MPLTIEAIYEDGVLKPAQPLPFREHEKVHVTVHAAVSRARQTAGLLRWTGDPALLERFIMDPELDPSEGPARTSNRDSAVRSAYLACLTEPLSPVAIRSPARY